MNRLRKLIRRWTRRREDVIELTGRALVVTEEDPLFLKVVLHDPALDLIDCLEENAKRQLQAVQALHETIEARLGVGR